ncbi:MAG: type II CAAX prenyl endopeptidase Rce1 family protein, partial [Candidatus Hodarchaeota archaeon]
RIIGLFILPVTTILLSIFYGWLQRKTDSIWAPSLAHAAHNSISGLILMLLFMGGPNWIFLSHFGILTWIPLGLICAWILLTSQLTLPRENRL